MKALSIKQPWASLIVEGIKDIENRTWKCPQKYIGQRVLIHAGADYSLLKTYPTSLFTQNKWEKINEDESFAMEFTTAYWMWHSWKNINPFFPLSAIIGSVEIVDCVINHPSIWAEKSETNCSEKCRSKNCEHFIEWGFGGCNDCRSCKLIGQSYEVDEVPKDCPYGMKINTTYNLVLANPIKFDKPIPCKGKLSFWESGIEVCHICGHPANDENICEVCGEFYCDKHAAAYDQFSQIDFNCCKSCADNYNSR